MLRFSGLLTAMKKTVNSGKSKGEKYAETESEVKVPVRILNRGGGHS